jgi:hypothetical protein
MTFCARDPDNKNFLLDPDPTFECTSPEFPTADISVADPDPGCELFPTRIPGQKIPDPESRSASKI